MADLVDSVTGPGARKPTGPWSRMEDIDAMRGDPRAQAGIRRLMELCTEAAPGAFRRVAEVPG